MARISKNGCTMKQMAYAKGILGAKAVSKRALALNVGYGINSANSVSTHIEAKPGFNNAMTKLAVESNNLALAAMHEFKARGFKDFSNKDLVGALNAIGNAWSRFNKEGRESRKPEENKLRTVILQQIENQTVNNSPEEKPPVVDGEVEK